MSPETQARAKNGECVSFPLFFSVPERRRMQQLGMCRGATHRATFPVPLQALHRCMSVHEFRAAFEFPGRIENKSLQSYTKLLLGGVPQWFTKAGQFDVWCSDQYQKCKGRKVSKLYRFPQTPKWRCLHKGSIICYFCACAGLLRSWHPFWGSPPRCSSSAQKSRGEQLEPRRLSPLNLHLTEGRAHQTLLEEKPKAAMLAHAQVWDMDVVLLRGAELTAVARETRTCVALGSAPGALGPFSPRLSVK